MQKSLLKVLAKAYWRPFVVAGLFKLGHDLMAFALPQILKLFIGWIDDKESAKQWGFIYALGLFVVPGIQTILLHQYFWTGTANGLIMKNSLTAELYRKSLVLSSRARKMMTHGEIVNLMAVDAQKFQEISTYLHMIWSAPLQISLSLYFLYRELGSAIFTGVAIMIILIPINAFVGKKIGTFMREIMMLKDKRLKVISEMLNSMKVVKLYAWEKFFSKWITDVRKSELDAIWRKAKVGIWMAISWSVSPFMVTLAAFATYILIDPEENILTPQKAFVSITYFNLLRFPMQMLPMMLMQLFELMVAVTRLQNFINLPETEKRETSGDEIHGSIKVKNGHFKWDLDSSENTLHDINLHVKPGELVAIVGHIGSGKSSLLSAFLNEMETVDETGKLAKDDAVEMLGSIGYVPQEAWLQNATLEENIIFGNDKKSSYYKQCIDAAALKSDLEILPSGDQTEIGEKGINLSGGQKQRVSLARAAYASPDILLFDDPLSAVDPHVAKEIFEKLISEKSLMKDKTRVLVTHATQFLPRCDRVILVAKGRIIDQGVYQDVFDNNPAFHPILKTAVEAEKSDYETVQSSTSDQSVKSSDSKEKKMTSGKLIASEAMKEGTVDAEVFKNYFNHFGWKSVIIILCLNITRFCLGMGENLWLASWSDDSKTLQSNLNMGNQNSSNSTGNIEHPTDEYEDIIPVKTRLSVYSVLGLSQAIFVVSQSLFAAKAGIRAGKRLHMDLIDALVQFPISFYDKTPTGRILNRVGKDIETVDAPLIRSLEMWTFCGFRVLFGCISICVGSPYYLIALPPFFWLYWKIQRIFVSTTRQLKRMESVSKSPIYAHFGESINGASTIRAYDHKGRFIDRNAELIDANSQANYYGSVIAYRWLAVRLEFLSHTLVLIASIIFCLVRESESTTAAKVGFALSNAVMMSQTLNWFVRQTSDVETHIVSVERLSEYSNDRETFPYEKRTDDDDQVLADSWPQKGKLELKNFSLVYKKDNPPALDNLELHIENGQKVGICGRTGSGKSSLALSLFRLFEPEEKSQYILDGVDCMRIDLERLRKTLTIIPQEPILFSSTLRRNLDPFDQFSDNEIHETLRLAHLSRFVNEELEKGLDHEVSEGGTNLSAGQRQLICLARALLRKTKILILDEATASVDSETDQLVQKTIRNEFKDCTILAVAHRIDTIDDYDKILVLDKGQIIEFDSPENLKTREDGVYRSMYDAAMGNKKDQ
jgi:ABC-type multidrug transport system fused ATPase/permease subunit